MVSQLPAITAAALPGKESGPVFSIMLSTTTREPLPETGLKMTSEISSFGILSSSNNGAAAFSKNCIAPEEVSASMAMKIPMRKGRISTQV